MILENINYVVKNSNNVKINFEKIDKTIPLIENCKTKNWFEPFKKYFSDTEIILLLFLCGSINFCFWKNLNYKEKYEDKIYYKSQAVFLSLIKYFMSNKQNLNVDFLKSISYKKFKKIFNQKLFLMYKRYNSFKNVAIVIFENRASFFNNVLQQTSSKDLLKMIVSNFKTFNDVSSYDKKKVEFYKRAIILTNDLYENVDIIKNSMKDIDALPACADYNVPRFLFDTGILEYSDKLRSIINKKKLIRHDSKYEIEIRSNMIYAVVEIQKRLKKNNNNISMVAIDNILWNLSKKNLPLSNHHRTITIFY